MLTSREQGGTLKGFSKLKKGEINRRNQTKLEEFCYGERSVKRTKDTNRDKKKNQEKTLRDRVEKKRKIQREKGKREN